MAEDKTSSAAATAIPETPTLDDLRIAIKEANYLRLIDICFDHPELINEYLEHNAYAFGTIRDDSTKQLLMLKKRTSSHQTIFHRISKDQKNYASSSQDRLPLLNTTEYQARMASLFVAIKSNDFNNIIQRLCAYPEFLNLQFGNEQQTLLSFVVSKGQEHAIKLLLLFDADVHPPDASNKSPLYWAVFHYIGALTQKRNELSACFHRIIKILIKSGADPLQNCAQGGSSSHYSSPALLAECALSQLKNISEADRSLLDSLEKCPEAENLSNGALDGASERHSQPMSRANAEPLGRKGLYSTSSRDLHKIATTLNLGELTTTKPDEFPTLEFNWRDRRNSV